MAEDTTLLTIDRKPTEQLRVIWAEWKGRRFVSIRVWWRNDEEDEWKPGKGVTVRPEEVEAIAQALSHVLSWLNSTPAHGPM